MTNAAPTRPRAKRVSTALREWANYPRSGPLAERQARDVDCDPGDPEIESPEYAACREIAGEPTISFQAERADESDTIFVGPRDNEDLLIIVELEDGRIWLGCNHGDPENPVSAAEVAERLVEVLKGADLPESAEESFYGAYFTTVSDAMIEAFRWLTIESKDWPKDYTKPILEVPVIKPQSDTKH